MRPAVIDRLRARMVPPQCHLMAGRAAESRDRARLDVAGPIDGRRVTRPAERLIHDDFVVENTRCASAMKVGDPLRLDTDIGAVVSEAPIEGNLDFVANAKNEGTRLVCGWQRILEASGGAHMAPKVCADVAPTARLFQEEVFGPVLAVTPSNDKPEAIRLANATHYALAGAVWTANLSRAHPMVSAMCTGVVQVNTYGGADITVPLGGFGQSGFGRNKSLHAFDSSTDLKTAWIAL
jgi:4-(gamma-glutamylamino)butanal dehydrogenase